MTGIYTTKRNTCYHYNLIQKADGKYFIECWIEKLQEKRTGGCKSVTEFREPTKELINHCQEKYGIEVIAH